MAKRGPCRAVPYAHRGGPGGVLGPAGVRWTRSRAWEVGTGIDENNELIKVHAWAMVRSWRPAPAPHRMPAQKNKKQKSNLGIPSEKKMGLYTLLIMTRDTPNDLRKKKITSDLKPLLFVCKKILHFWCPEKKKSGEIRCGAGTGRRGRTIAHACTFIAQTSLLGSPRQGPGPHTPPGGAANTARGGALRTTSSYHRQYPVYTAH